ncbi:MAG: hypothetical protein KF901_02540 [Myxococcales bacterium]|nr:hypothetical protein [Myxococcales bacterium]
MKGFALGLSISLAFILGCVSAPLIVARLSAQNPPHTPRWEYSCDSVRTIGSMRALLARVGPEGWELAAVDGALFCFKRPTL